MPDELREVVEAATPGPCVPWPGPRNAYGYGRIRLQGGGEIGAHRVVWEGHYGAIPEGMEVMHACDNPPCVNPLHLRLGTHAENMADMKTKGRARTNPRPLAERGFSQCPTCGGRACDHHPDLSHGHLIGRDTTASREGEA